MKKIILFLLLVFISVTVSARKSYITVYTYNNNGTTTNSYVNIRMTGDVPGNIEGFWYSTSNPHYCYNDYEYGRLYTPGEILNLLSEYGYEVAFVDNDFHCFLLSKEIPSEQTVSEGDVNKDGEVNIGDINKIVALILGIVKENPELLEQYGIVLPK